MKKRQKKKHSNKASYPNRSGLNRGIRNPDIQFNPGRNRITFLGIRKTEFPNSGRPDIQF